MKEAEKEKKSVGCFSYFFGAGLGMLTGFIHPVIPLFAIPFMLYVVFKVNREISAEDSYKSLLSKMSIPKKTEFVTFLEGADSLVPNHPHYFWLEDNFIHIFPQKYPETYSQYDIQKLKFVKIPLQAIEYYSAKGDFYTETKISGGGGGGISLKGALVGGVVGATVGGKTGGAAGAIIAGRKKVKDVQSETIIHDSRATCLYYRYENDVCVLRFGYNDYDVLYKLIPEKSYDAHVLIQAKHTTDKTSMDVADQIKSLKNLKDEGIINEEEFEAAKGKLLNKL